MNNMTTQTIETDKQASRTMQKKRVLNCDVPVYLYPSAYAQRHGEIEEYRVSRQANIACRDAIDQAIRTYYHDNMLNKKAAQSVVEQYGFDRTMYVLAITVLDKEWDGRISQSNKNWAKMQPIFTDHDEMGNERRRAFVVRSHPGLIDLFLREVRYEKAVSMEKKTLNPTKQKSEKER